MAEPSRRRPPLSSSRMAMRPLRPNLATFLALSRRGPLSVLGDAPHAIAPTDDRTPSSVVAWGWYVDGYRQPCDDLAEATQAALEGNGFVWLGLHDPSDADMSEFANQFNLHPLAIEDAVEGHSRSKLEQFGDTLFAVVSTVAYVEHDRLSVTAEIVSTGQVMVFVGDHFVMTVRRGPHARLGGLRRQLEAQPERLAEGPSTVLYAVMDKIVDDYMDVVAAIEEDVDEVEALVFGPDVDSDVSEVYQLKRELIEFKRAVLPLGAPLQALATRPYASIPESARAYFREIFDHHVQARESILSFDEVLTSILQFAQTRLSMADNQDMRRLSALVAMAALPTMLAGIYGMNFENMPELKTHYGYFIVLGVMLLSIVVLFVFFRRKKWL